MRGTKKFVGVVGGLVLTLGTIVGCSSDTAETVSAAEGSDAAFPATVDHIYGSTTVTEKPERIVALGVSDTDAVLALGGVPVGNTGYAFYENGLGPWTESLVGDAQLTLIEDDAQPNLEQIASLAPDLIVGVSAGFEKDVYDKLSEIAPTIARPSGTAAYAVPRVQLTESIAAAMGVPDQGVALNARTDELIADAVAAHPEFAGKTGVAVLPYDGQYGAFLPGDGRGQFLTTLGFAIPESITSQDTGTSFFVAVSAENVSMFDGDLVLILGPDENFDVVAQDPTFGTVKSAIVATSKDQRGAITYNSVLSISYALDSLVPRLSEALT